MSIVNTVDLYDFRRAFADYNRADNFSHEGLEALYEWLEEYSDSIGEPYEMDIIALCCEFTEYSDLAEVQANYNSTKIDTINDLHNHTIVIEFNGGLIIQNF